MEEESACSSTALLCCGSRTRRRCFEIQRGFSVLHRWSHYSHIGCLQRKRHRDCDKPQRSSGSRTRSLAYRRFANHPRRPWRWFRWAFLLRAPDQPSRWWEGFRSFRKARLRQMRHYRCPKGRSLKLQACPTDLGLSRDQLPHSIRPAVSFPGHKPEFFWRRTR